MTGQPGERRPIGWWLKTADARIEHAFEDVFEGQSITRREWQVLEPVSRAPVLESELLQRLEAFAGAQDAVNELRRRGLLADGGHGVLTLTDAGQVAHGRAAAGVARVRSAVSAALPEENYATLLRLLAELVDGLDRTSKPSQRAHAHDVAR
ncbi:MAG: hypothetical protein ABIQ53_04525 [Terracoccus sp.]